MHTRRLAARRRVSAQPSLLYVVSLTLRNQVRDFRRAVRDDLHASAGPTDRGFCPLRLFAATKPRCDPI
jgi:hypothetical protein